MSKPIATESKEGHESFKAGVMRGEGDEGVRIRRRFSKSHRPRV